MKGVKVKMICDFVVPNEKDAYGIRTSKDHSWKDYAEHDMIWRMTIHSDQNPERYDEYVNLKDVSFEYGDEVEIERELND